MIKILFVFGTRPEAIKMAPLVKECQKFTDQFETIVCVTGQHREMLDQVLKLFAIEPDFDLNIMKPGQDLYDVTTRVLIGMRDVLNDTKPNIVLVHGDTSTSTAAALAAFYQQVPVGHIEAGLRTNNIYNPWPEEINRQITGRLATYHFAPTQQSRINLLNEGVKDAAIIVTGNTVIDSLFLALDKINNDKGLQEGIFSDLQVCGLPNRILNSLFSINKNFVQRQIVLITGHRRENFGEGFLNICKAIRILSEKYTDIDFIYPMHLNPNVRKPIQEVFGDFVIDNIAKESKNMFFVEPLDYLPFVFLMEKCSIVLTDSGGIQEEAPGLGKPVLVMRDTTERPEALESGTVKLVGTNSDLIVSEVSKLLDDKSYYKSMLTATNPYGDGTACKQIIHYIANCK